MKHLIAIILAFTSYLTVWGQIETDHQLFETNSKSRLYYVDLKDREGSVYAMGRHIDVAGSGYAILKTDTLQKQPDGSYAGSQSRIIREKEELYLISTFGKTRKFRLDKVSNQHLANNNLNNAYYLDQYFAMNTKLNKAFPLNHHDFRGAFFTWKALPNNEKEMNYTQFRTFADARLKEVADSTSAIHDKYTSLTNHIVQNICLMDYATLKDSVAQLPAEYSGKSRYYGTVINAVAVSQPEYYLLLAADFPQHQSLIFTSVDYKQVHAGIENVAGHDDMKKAFLKERKSNRAAIFHSIGALALGLALTVVIIMAFK